MAEWSDPGNSITRALTGPQHHEPVRDRYRPMRGQAYVQMIEEESAYLFLPKTDPREQKSHRGRVLALGPPARLTDHPDSPELPWGVSVGDEVVFVLAVWLDRMRVLEMLGVSGHVAVVAQVEILAVEGVHERDTVPELVT